MKIRYLFFTVFAAAGVCLQFSCGPIKNIADRQTNADPLKSEVQNTPENKLVPKISDSWGKTKSHGFVPIAELMKNDPVDKVFETEGYVVDSTEGCDCPPDGNCNCPVPHIVISAKKYVSGSRDQNEDEIMIWTELGKFDRDQKYRFKVKRLVKGSVEHYGLLYLAHKAVENGE
ncbi:MAG: hypothetical protein R2681_03155 [Pyrinomonadaceae bacterium]